MSQEPTLAIVTNSTYDGLCYDAVRVADLLSGGHRPTVFASQSTHKLPAALSQAAMIHVKESPGRR
ncbi:hypothetical protein ACWD4G_22320 [Streptomyces sp. NPDC002643]